MSLAVHIGDCRTVLPTLPERGVQCVCTSPPYWALRDYGVEGQLGLEETPEAYVEALVGVFRAVRRVLRDDGTVWLNLGDSYLGGGGYWPDAPSNVARVQDEAGAWGAFHRTPTERLAVRKAAGRREGLGTLKAKDLVGIPWRVALALQADGWYLRSEIIWAKPCSMPENVKDRPTKTHEQIFLLSKQASYYYDADAIREPSAVETSTSGYHRQRRQSDGHQRTRPKKANRVDYRNQHDGVVCNPTGANARSVWTITPESYPGAHYATFPGELARRCIVAGTRMGDVVLDPFAGTGTVGEIAEQNGRSAVLIELSPEYEPCIRERTAQRGLFARDAELRSGADGRQPTGDP